MVSSRSTFAHAVTGYKVHCSGSVNHWSPLNYCSTCSTMTVTVNKCNVGYIII